MSGLKILDVVVTVFLVVGGLCWGWMGFFNVNLITTFFGETTVWSRLFYALFGLSALYEIGGFTFGFKAVQHRWCETPAGFKH
jgi:uncharacterized protein